MTMKGRKTGIKQQTKKDKLKPYKGQSTMNEKLDVVVVDGAQLTDYQEEGINKIQAMVALKIEREKKRKKDKEKEARLYQLKLKSSIAKAVTPHKNVKRNAPCDCGSGLKFKKCCLKKGGA